MLRLLNLPNIQTVKNLLNLLTQFIEPPKQDQIVSGINLLTDLGCIKNETITNLGIKMSEFSGLDPQLVLVLIVAHSYNCAYEVINIIAMTETAKNNISNVFSSFPDNLRKKFYEKKKHFKTKSSDHLSLLNIFEKYTKHLDDKDKGKKWCYDNFISLDTMIKAKKYARKLDRDYREINLSTLKIEMNNDVAGKSVEDRILYSFYTGLQNQIAQKKGDYYQTKYAKREKIGLSKESFISDSLPKKCIYGELFGTRGTFNINIVSKIK